MNQKITTRYLDKLGICWELARNGEEAVKAVQEQDFDLVLMDVRGFAAGNDGAGTN